MIQNKVFQMKNAAEERIIKTMQERGIKKVNLVMTWEEYAKENGIDPSDEPDDEYDEYRSQEAPYVIYFDKRGYGIDLAAYSVELVDGSGGPRFKLECHNREEGSDWFYDSDLTNLSMIGVYDAMEAKLEMKDEPTQKEEKKQTLEEMVSRHAYDEIVSKVKEQVGEESFDYIFPGIKKALEEGSGKVREEILINWLDCDSMKICSHCGKIMEKGWYLDYQGYACSDECCMAIMSIGKEEYEKYSIYKTDIEEYLEEEGEGRTPEDLTKEEIDDITAEIVDGLDGYYYTEWY